MEQIFRRTSSNLSICKGIKVLTNILPLIDTNCSVKKLTLFLPGLTLLQSPRTKYLVAWLVFIRFVGHVCHQWHTSAIPLKTSQPCDLIQKDLQKCTSQVNINGSTTLQLHHQLPSSICWSEGQGEWRHQQLWPTITLGWIGLTPNIARLGIVGTWSTSCDSCNCLLIAMCVLDIVCSCFVCFLRVYCYLVHVLILASRP
jgi:hypothetical protein